MNYIADIFNIKDEDTNGKRYTWEIQIFTSF